MRGRIAHQPLELFAIREQRAADAIVNEMWWSSSFQPFAAMNDFATSTCRVTLLIDFP
jgi:hypothetical protein